MGFTTYLLKRRNKISINFSHITYIIIYLYQIWMKKQTGQVFLQCSVGEIKNPFLHFWQNLLSKNLIKNLHFFIISCIISCRKKMMFLGKRVFSILISTKNCSLSSYISLICNISWLCHNNQIFLSSSLSQNYSPWGLIAQAVVG